MERLRLHVDVTINNMPIVAEATSLQEDLFRLHYELLATDAAPHQYEELVQVRQRLMHTLSQLKLYTEDGAAERSVNVYIDFVKRYTKDMLMTARNKCCIGKGS